MLKEKTIQVIDTDKKKEGDFITFCYTEWGDEGEKENGKWINGIVKTITETEISIVTVSPKLHTVTLQQLLEDRVRFKN